MMSETRKDVCIRLWRLMKQPFVLPCGYAHTHDCKWKAIDAGLLGCELCGASDFFWSLEGVLSAHSH